MHYEVELVTRTRISIKMFELATRSLTSFYVTSFRNLISSRIPNLKEETNILKHLINAIKCHVKFMLTKHYTKFFKIT